MGLIGRPSLLTHLIDIKATFAPESSVIVMLTGLPSKEAERTKCGRGEIIERNGGK